MTTGNREDIRKRFVVEITRVPGADFEALKEALRHTDTATMTTPQVVDFCKARVPGCTIEEIVRALQQVGDEQLQEADRLSRDSSDAGS